MLQDLLMGLGDLLSVTNLIYINIGVLIGIVFGAVPGLTVILAIVLFTPMTFGLEPITAILTLLGMYCGGTYGGSITAILIKTPGTPPAAATLLDGYPAAQNGKARKALDMALVASTIAGLISACVLLFAAPQIAKLALNFGPAEYFILAVFGISIIASVSGDNMFKGIISGCIGILISMVGLDGISGALRFTFGNYRLFGGIALVVALIGLFAVSEIFQKANYRKSKDEDSMRIEIDNNAGLTFAEFKGSIKTIIRSSFIGTIVGSIPGTGAGIAAFLGYSEAKKRSKNADKFGTGELEGVAAAEAGNNGVTGATLIPLLTLGIPGDATTAILLGALLMHGLVPGPSLFEQQGNIMYAIMIGLIITNLFMLFQGKLLVKYFAKVSKIPYALLAPLIAVFCTAGAFSVNNTVFDIYIIVSFGIISYFLQKLQFSQIPILLGIVLGPIAEINLRRALVISEGSYSIFFTRPISLFFILLIIGSNVLSVYRKKKKEKTDKLTKAV